MSKLCYKVGGTVKKYDLKDSANKPRLAVKSGGVTKYLGLNQGTKDGELQVKIGGQPYYAQTWAYNNSTYWNTDVGPEKGCNATAGNTTQGGCAVWTLRNADGYLIAAVGRIGADRPDDWASAVWAPNQGGISNINTNTHAGYDKPYIRLCTIVFGMFDNGQWLPVNTPANIYSHLLNSRYTTSGSSMVCYESKFYSTTNPTISSLGSQALRSYGYEYRNDLLTDEQIAEGRSYVQGPINMDNAEIFMRLSVGKTSLGLPRISAGGVHDSGGKRYLSLNGSSYTYAMPYCRWGVRDFYIEWPQVQRLEVTPKQVLDAWKAILTAEGTWSTDFGTVYGRNY